SSKVRTRRRSSQIGAREARFEHGRQLVALLANLLNELAAVLTVSALAGRPPPPSAISRRRKSLLAARDECHHARPLRSVRHHLIEIGLLHAIWRRGHDTVQIDQQALRTSWG